MFKTVAIVAVAAAGGVLIGNFVDSKVGDKFPGGANVRPAVKVGLQAGSAALVFGVVSSLL